MRNIFLYLCSPGFLNFHTISILGQITLCMGYCPVHCRMFTNILASSHGIWIRPPQLSPLKMSPNIAKCPLENKVTLGEEPTIHVIHYKMDLLLLGDKHFPTQSCQMELATMMECSLFVLSNMVLTRHVQSLSPWHVTSTSANLIFYFIVVNLNLNSPMWLFATASDSTIPQRFSHFLTCVGGSGEQIGVEGISWLGKGQKCESSR